MASTYTSNGGIEKIGTGDQAGTWGTTTNLNMDIIDRLTNGVATISISGTTHTLTTTDGTLSDGMYKVLNFNGSPSGTNTITIAPNDQQKLFFVKNSTSGGHSIIIKQGSGTTVTILNTKTAIVYADGGGSGANVAQIETGSDEFTENVNITTSSGAVLTLRSSDTDITANDVLGKLQYRSSADAQGGDAVEVSASIEAVAEGTFTATANPTTLDFKTGLDAPATTKLKLTSAGLLQIPADGSITANHFSVGTGADLKVYHDGTDSYVDDTGTGNLNLKGSIVQLLSTGGESMAKATTDGAVELYHDGTSKFATKSDGIDVTGEVQCDSLDVDGNADISGTLASGTQTVTGTITASGDITANSDERLKTDVKTIENALYKVMSMRGVSYTKDDKKSIGVIAQEIEKIIPEVVHEGEYKSVAYGNIVGVLIEAVKDLKKELDDLKQECNCNGSSD
jgi:hypothetical protein